jgi:nitrate reductase assembly molybdenum cofactor insertion protein NarJ
METTTEKKSDLLVTSDLFRLLSRGFTYPDPHVLNEVKGIGEELLGAGALSGEIKVRVENILREIKEKEILLNYSALFMKGNIPICESYCCSKLDAIADAAAFYKAFGLSHKSGEAPDALPYELEFIALLLVKSAVAETDDQRKIVSDAFRKFLSSHLKEFSEKFILRLSQAQPVPYYRELSALLDVLVKSEIAKYTNL